jgi:hypothetical protein
VLPKKLSVMSNSKIAVQFASLTNLWAFKNELKLNIYCINSLERTITFQAGIIDNIGAAVEKFNGQIVRTMQNVS